MQGGLKRGASLGRLSRHGSFAAEAGKVLSSVHAPLSRGGSLVIDLEAQAVSPSAAGQPAPPLCQPHTAPARTMHLQSVPSNGE